MDIEDHTQLDWDEVNTKWEQVRIKYFQTSEACLETKLAKEKKWIPTVTWDASQNRDQ